jgi:transcriptional regulator with XRE-family HTH domain
MSELFAVPFGSLLRTLRTAAGLTQEELAEAARVSYRTVSDLERGVSRFPDGNLYVNLRGFDPAAPPVRPAEVIRDFLSALGVDPSGIPVSMDAQAALYRSLLAGRRFLLLLDNARDAEQVRTLIPGTETCLVLVTSRSQLSSLADREGAQLLEPDLLTIAEARELLTLLAAGRGTRRTGRLRHRRPGDARVPRVPASRPRRHRVHGPAGAALPDRPRTPRARHRTPRQCQGTRPSVGRRRRRPP